MRWSDIGMDWGEEELRRSSIVLKQVASAVVGRIEFEGRVIMGGGRL